MGQCTFKIDNKDLPYKKLIKLPTAYYRLKSNGNGYAIDSHIGTAELGDTIRDVKLQKQGDKIVLYKGNSALKLQNGKDFTIEQEDIIGKDKNAIVNKLQEGKTIKVTLQDTTGPDFGVGLSLYNSGNRLTGVLKFINFYDENDPVLQKIKKETGGLYFTIKDDNIYISDKNGKCLPVCNDGSCYQYQYTKNEHDILEINEISTIIEGLTKTKQCDVSEAIESPIKVGQDFTLQKGKELSDNIYEANIALNDKPIATLPKIGYYMLDDQLIMRNHVTEEEVKIPRDFHYLKVVKSSNNDDYKLTFCNFLGNEFFEYKKYDPQYSNVSDEYKFISLSCMKEKRNLNLGELLSHRPSFFITEESPEPGSPGHCSADVFELTKNGKGKKMATLIDQFGFFDKESKFQYCDYHTKAEYGVYDLPSIEKKCTITDANSEFYLTGYDNLILHTTPHELF